MTLALTLTLTLTPTLTLTLTLTRREKLPAAAVRGSLGGDALRLEALHVT